ncbi:hypothetical protein CHUAL_006337 [Chamberlinius hualienensis]
MFPSVVTDNKTSTTMESVVNLQPMVNAASAQKAKWKLSRCRIIAVVILGLTFITGALLVTYMALYRSSTTPVMYTFVLKEKSSDSGVNVETQLDQSNNIEYMTSPEIDENGKIVGKMKGIRDRDTGIEAYISKEGDKCLVGKLSNDGGDEDDYGDYTNGSVNERKVDGVAMYRLLNQTIDPYVLKSVAGDNIVEFCSDRLPVWMIPVDDTDTTSTDKRVKRAYYNYRYRCYWNCWRRWCTRRCYWW